MCGNEYLNYLFELLEKNKQNVLRQEGKSDIENPSYVEQVEIWYGQIKEYISENHPQYYVKSIDVFQDSQQIIKEINYNYCNDLDSYNYLAINIFWLN